MTESEHRALYERFAREVLEQGRFEALDALVRDDFVGRMSVLGQAVGRGAFKAALRGFRAALGDVQITARDVIASGERLVVHHHVSGAHRGDFLGIPATGERIEYDEIAIMRFEDGAIAEYRTVADTHEPAQRLRAAHTAAREPSTQPSLIPIAQTEVIKKFFDDYAERFNRSLQGDEVDPRDIAESFAKHFVEASPAGVSRGKNGLLFRWMIPRGFAHYKKIGTTRMSIDNVEVESIDPMHALAKVHWDSRYTKPDGRSDRIAFDVTYLLHFEGAHPKIFAYITGDEEKVLREHGLS